MRRRELEQIRNLRRVANQIQACRKPVPAAIASKYHAALGSLQRWEELAAAQDGLSFLPLTLLMWGGSLMSLAAIGYTLNWARTEVLPRLGEEFNKGVETFGQVSQVAMWALLGLGIYNLATKGKLL